MKGDATKDLNHIFVHEGHLIDEALKKGVREALVRHKKEGRRVVVVARAMASRVLSVANCRKGASRNASLR